MPEVMGIRFADQALIKAGLWLFLLGLVTGFVVPALPFPRLGLASHLEGVMNGLFLLALGVIWKRLDLSRSLASLAFYAALFGTFANWLATLLAALWGAAGLMPLAGGAVAATSAQELVVASLLVSLSLAMVLVCLIALWGLRRANRPTA